LNDKDYYGNKRIEAAGQMLSLLFEDLFKTFNSELKANIEKTIAKKKNSDAYIDFSRSMNTGIITDGLIRPISSGNWAIKRFKVDNKGVTQILNRLSYIGSLGMMTR